MALAVTSSGDETREELGYLEQIQTQVADLARDGESLRGSLNRLREIERSEFNAVFDSLATDLAVAREFASVEPPTDSLQAVWSLYRLTLDAWTSGTQILQEAVLRAADNPDDNLAVNLITDGLAELRTGDELFVDLQELFERAETPEPLAPLAPAQLAPNVSGLASLAASYTTAARAETNQLGLRPGLTMSQILSNPEWTVDANEEAVTVFTETIEISGVITNSGNVASPVESLLLTLTGQDEPIRVQAEVPVLEPGAQTTVVFDPIDVEPDVTYLVRLELIVSGADADASDNALEVEFRISPN